MQRLNEACQPGSARRAVAVRCECKPIADEGHFENAQWYIADHESQGGVIYPARDVLRSINPSGDFDPNSLLLD